MLIKKSMQTSSCFEIEPYATKWLPAIGYYQIHAVKYASTKSLRVLSKNISFLASEEISLNYLYCFTPAIISR